MCILYRQTTIFSHMTKMFLYIKGKSNLCALSGLRWNPIPDLRVSLRPSVINFNYERQCCSNQIYNVLYGHTKAYLRVLAFSLKKYTLTFVYCHLYVGDSKIKFRLVGKKKRVIIAPKCTVSSNK
jgi:hypothetical protein